MKHRMIAAVLFSVSCGVCVASERQAPTAPKSVQKEQHRFVQSNQAPAKEQFCTDQFPCAVKILPSEETKKISALEARYESDKAKYENGKVRNERLTARATVALAVVTSLLAFFTFRLWSITKTLVEGAEDTAKKQLRAYVALDTIDHFSKEGPLRFRIHNYGQTPAHHVSIVYTIFEKEQKSTYKHPATSSGDPLANQMLHPQQQWKYEAVGGARDRVLEAGLRFETIFFVYGRIDYMDIYRRYWETYFCQKYDPKQPEGQRCTPHYFHNYELPIT